MDSVVHFEIPVDDDTRAHSFYADVFGWRIDHMPEMNYDMVVTGDTTEDGMPKTPGHINGGMFHRSDEFPRGPVITIGTDDLDATLERVRSHGGTIEGEPFETEGVGRGAYVRDTEGNVIGLWQDLMGRARPQG